MPKKVKKRKNGAEIYRRRIERGLAKGLSKAQARGHGGPGRRKVTDDRRFQEGLKAVRRGEGLTKAAKSIHAAPETLKNYFKQVGIEVKRVGRNTQIVRDTSSKVVSIFSQGREFEITVNFDNASKVGRYQNAVKTFLETNDRSALVEFQGASVIDVNGKRYVLETGPNMLHKLATAQTEPFEEVYRIKGLT